MKNYSQIFESYMLNEENELLKAQDASKGSMFLAKKAIDPILAKLKKGNLIKSFKTTVSPYNSGYELKIKLKVNYDSFFAREKDSETEKLGQILFSMGSSLYIYPGSFFQEYLDDGDQAYIEGRFIQMSKDTNNLYPKYPIKKKADIKNAYNQYNKSIEAQIVQLNRIVDSVVVQTIDV